MRDRSVLPRALRLIEMRHLEISWITILTLAGIKSWSCQLNGNYKEVLAPSQFTGGICLRWWCGRTAVISDALAVKTRPRVHPICNSCSVAFWPRCFTPSPVMGSMPGTQAVNVLNDAVRSEFDPLPHLPSFFLFPPSLPSLSFIHCHHSFSSRSQTCLLYVIFSFSILTLLVWHVVQMMKGGKHTNTWWVWHPGWQC